MKRLVIICIFGFYQLLYAQNIGQINYSGTCQNVGYNDSGENILANCSSGILSAAECSFVINSNDAHIHCQGATYLFECNSISRIGNWYKLGTNAYKCIN